MIVPTLKSSFLPLSILFIAALFLSFSAFASPPLSDDKIESIYNYTVKIQDAMSVMQYNVLSTFNRMGDGDEIKDSQVNTMLAVPRDGEEHLLILLDEDGQATDTLNNKEDQESVKAGPLEAFEPENRNKYSFTNEGFTEDGFLIVGLAPNDEVVDGFLGKVFVDTVEWAPHRVSGAPYPLPDKVQEMDMSIIFAPVPAANGIYLPESTLTTGMAKAMIFFKINFKVIQEFSNYSAISDLPSSIAPESSNTEE